MNLLLDTCTFLWLALEPARLSAEAARLLGDPANELWLSVVSAWEIAVKYSKGHLTLPQTPDVFVPAQRGVHGIEVLELFEDEATYVLNLPLIHKDPFDRLLICQAIVNDFVILTPDLDIQKYAVKTRW